MNADTLFTNPNLKSLLDSGRIREALDTTLQAAAASKNRIRQRLSLTKVPPATQENALFATLTLGDFLYDYLRLDPMAVEGIDFSRGGDLGGRLGLGYFSDQHQDLHGAALQGSIDQMHGYVAERLAAHHLMAQGHDVTFPETSNQEGWDLLVDGSKFQVKCLQDPQNIHEHFQRFDYPVITNSELADSLHGMDQVYIDPLLSYKDVHHLTTTTLDQGSELMDFNIPLISLAVSSAAAMRDFWAGELSLCSAVAEAGATTASRVVFAKVGGFTGKTLGFLLFGPAGGVVGALGGTLAGGMQGGAFGKQLRRRYFTRASEKRVEEALWNLNCRVLEFFPQKADAWHAKEEKLRQAFRRSNVQDLKDCVQEHMQQDLGYIQNKWQEFKSFSRHTWEDLDPREKAERLLTRIRRSGVHSHEIQDALKALHEELAHMNGRMDDLQKGQQHTHRQMSSLQEQLKELGTTLRAEQAEQRTLLVNTFLETQVQPHQEAICQNNWPWQDAFENTLAQHLSQWEKHLENTLASLAARDSETAASQALFKKTLLQEQEQHLRATIEEYICVDLQKYELLAENCQLLLESQKEQWRQNEADSLSLGELHKQLALRYAFLRQNSLEFLATAEYYARIGENAEKQEQLPFNYAPAIVEYGKAVETELQGIKGLHKLSFFDILVRIENCRLSPLYRELTHFHSLRKLRNDCAHSQTASRAHLNQARSLLGLDEASQKGLLALLGQVR